MKTKVINHKIKELKRASYAISQGYDSLIIGTHITEPVIDSFNHYQKAINDLHMAITNENDLSVILSCNQAQKQIIANMMLFMQTDSPSAYDHTTFFGYNGYSRGRLNHEQFYNFLKHRFELLHIDARNISKESFIVNRKFTDNHDKLIKVDISSPEKYKDARYKIVKYIEEKEKEHSSDFVLGIYVELSTGNEYNEELIEGFKAEIKKIQMDSSITGIRFFAYEEKDGLLFFRKVQNKGRSENFDDKEFFSISGASLDLYQLSNTWSNAIGSTIAGPVRTTTQGVDYGVFNNFAITANAFYNNDSGAKMNQLVTQLKTQLEAITPNKNLSELSTKELLKLILAKETTSILSFIDIIKSEISNPVKKVINDSLQRIKNMIEPLINNDIENLSITEIREKYLIFNEELVMLLSLMPKTISLKSKLDEYSLANESNLNIKINNHVGTSGMAAISNLFSAIKEEIKAPKALLSEDVYYELPDLLTRLIKNEPTFAHMSEFINNITRHIQQIKTFNVGQYSTSDDYSSYDVVFFDTHSNNPNADNLISFDDIDFLQLLKENQEKLRKRKETQTIIIDVSTNSFADAEISNILNSQVTQELIEEKAIRIVVVQSLAKYASLGTDKYNGAIVKIYSNKNDQFSNHFEKLNNRGFTIDNTIADTFHSILFSVGLDVHTEFVERVRHNTNTMLEILAEKELEDIIRKNNDEKPVFFSIDVSSSIPSITNLSLNADIESEKKSIHHYIMNYMVRDSKDSNHMLRRRSGFGFLGSALSDCVETIRFVVGMAENDDSLEYYANTIVDVRQILKDLNFAIINSQDIIDTLSNNAKEYIRQQILKYNSKSFDDILTSNKLDIGNKKKTPISRMARLEKEDIDKTLTNRDMLILKIYSVYLQIREKL